MGSPCLLETPSWTNCAWLDNCCQVLSPCHSLPFPSPPSPPPPMCGVRRKGCLLRIVSMTKLAERSAVVVLNFVTAVMLVTSDT